MLKLALTNEQLCVLAQQGDEAARELLIEKNMGFIRQTANRIYADMAVAGSDLTVTPDDLVQEGCLGLLNAVNGFGPHKNIKFLTYAAPAIRNAMIDFMRSEWSVFEHRISSGARDSGACTLIRLDELLPGEEKMLRIEALADLYVKTPEQIYIETETRQELYAALNHLPAREQTYLLYRFGFTDDTEHSLRGTATHFQLSERRAKSTEKQALKNIRNTMNG